jgi:hypothetical protein
MIREACPARVRQRRAVLKVADCGVIDPGSPTPHGMTLERIAGSKPSTTNPPGT